jgi:hypothetical protein
VPDESCWDVARRLAGEVGWSSEAEWIGLPQWKPVDATSASRHPSAVTLVFVASRSVPFSGAFPPSSRNPCGPHREFGRCRGIAGWAALESGGVAIAVTAPPAVKIVGNVEGAGVTRTVKNTGAQTVYVSRDPAVTSVAAAAFSIAAAAVSPPISLAPGEELYAVCAAAQSSTVEVI